MYVYIYVITYLLCIVGYIIYPNFIFFYIGSVNREGCIVLLLYVFLQILNQWNVNNEHGTSSALTLKKMELDKETHLCFEKMLSKPYW